MALTSSDIGLLFRIKTAGTEEAAAATNKLKASVLADMKAVEGGADGAALANTNLGKSLSSMVNPAALAATGIAALGVAAVVTARAVYSLATEAASYGSKIQDARDKTGLAAETISALKYAAEQGGSSFEKIEGAVAKFNIVLGESNLGNEKAAATLAKYNVTAKDTDGALKQAIKTISEMTTADQKAVAAKELFRDRAAEIIPVIKGMNGNLDDAVKRVKDLGIAMDDEGARKAKILDDTILDLNLQVEGLSRTIGIALIPAVTRVAQSMSNWLMQNQSQVSRWSLIVEVAANNVVTNLNKIYNWFRDNSLTLRIQIAAITGGLSELALAFGRVVGNRLNRQADALQARRDAMPQEGAPSTAFNIPNVSIPRVRGGGRGGSGADRAAEQARREAERLAQADLTAQLRIEQNLLKTIEEEFSKSLKEIRKDFSISGDAQSFFSNMSKEYERFNDNVKTSLARINEFEKALLAKDATDNQRALLAQEQQMRFDALRKKSQEETAQNVELLKEDETRLFEDRILRAQIRFEAEMDLLRLQQQQLEVQKEQNRLRLEWIKSLTPDIGPANAGDSIDDPYGGLFGGWLKSWDDFVDAIELRSGTVTAAIGNMAGILEGAFNGFANALGNVIQNWILYGKTGPAIMRQVLASALASIAAQAAVEAIYATALGFVRLAQWDFGAAAAAFKSAALFASVAVGAGLAGRGIAGESFNRETQGGFGSAGQQAGGSRSGGGSYSGFGNDATIIDAGRNAPEGFGQSEVVFTINDKSDWFADMFEIQIRNNSKVRKLILDTAS